MPSGSFKQVDVQCPFYKNDGGKRITCEGLVDKSNISLGFLNWSDYEIHMRTFCCKHYKNCEIYRTLMRKYEDDNENG